MEKINQDTAERVVCGEENKTKQHSSEDRLVKENPALHSLWSAGFSIQAVETLMIYISKKKMKLADDVPQSMGETA